jgi:probable F420-dependent oxidoreductase
MAKKAEELGFDSFWCAEHPFMPVKTASRFPGSADGVIPETYAHFVDPFVALARASGTTSRIKLGTGIVLVPERHPLLLAKEVATLDLFSGGRFLFGIGAGWLREETEIMGGDFDHRWTQTRESVLAMKELWTKPEASFEGQYYKFPAVKSNPKPAQKPHPPVLIGGGGPTVIDRVLDHGDGWFPQWRDPDVLARIAELRARAERPMQVQMIGVPPDPKAFEQLEAAGVDRVSTWLESGPWSVVERGLEAWEAAINDLTGQ